MQSPFSPAALAQPSAHIESLEPRMLLAAHYYGFTSSAGSWSKGEAFAQEYGGHLASITNVDEQKFITDQFVRPNPKQTFWVGLTDRGTEGVFKWTTGELKHYINWKSGEPNDLWGEDFVSINWGYAHGRFGSELGEWNDEPSHGVDGSVGIFEGNPEPHRGIVEFDTKPAGFPNKLYRFDPNPDPDDQISEARSLANDSDAKSAAISIPADVDMYSIQVESGARYGFDIDTVTNGAPGLGSHLRLFDSSGRELASNNDRKAPDEPSTGFDSYIEYSFNSGGTYFIAVSHWNNRAYEPWTGGGDDLSTEWATGDYQLRVKPVDGANLQDPDDEISPDEATAFGRLTRSKSFNGSIFHSTDVDMYSFIVQKGQQIAFDIDPGERIEPFDSYIRIFNSKGEERAKNDNAVVLRDVKYRPHSFLEYVFEEAGTYYIGVSGTSNRSYNPLTGENDSVGRSTGEYKLVLVPMTYDVVGPDTKQRPSYFGRLELPNPDKHDAEISVSMHRISETGAYDQKIDPDAAMTWVVVHGRDSDPSAFHPLAKQVLRARKDEQVLLLDWSVGARDNWASLSLDGGAWIPLVGQWVASLVKKIGIATNNVNVIGHSWGSYVAYEIGERLHGIRSIAALDPARTAFEYADKYVNFRAVTDNSWSIYGEGRYGSAKLAGRADEAFTLKYREPTRVAADRQPSAGSAHSAPVSIFAAIIQQTRQAPEHDISRIFDLEQLLKRPNREWKENQYWGGSGLEIPRAVFEGEFVLSDRNLDGTWEFINRFNYVSHETGEKESVSINI